MEVASEEDLLFSTRYRSPCFTKEEVKTLLRLIVKYKKVVLNKLTSADACRAKEVAWIKIAKEFNKSNPSCTRSVEGIKMKWVNLKKDSRKLSKNLMDVNNDHLDDVTSQVVAMMSETENLTSRKLSVGTESNENSEDLMETDTEELVDSKNFIAVGCEDSDTNDNDDVVEISRNHRGAKFKMDETLLLLDMIEKHQYIILDKCVKATTSQAKEKTWLTIAKHFKKLNIKPERSANCLKMKWQNLKRKVKKETDNFTKEPHGELDDVLTRVLTLVSPKYKTENKSVDENSTFFFDNIDDTIKSNNSEENLGTEEMPLDDANCSPNDKRKPVYFSPKECRLLIHCVKKENKLISLSRSHASNEMKNLAWIRITKAFNRLNHRKKSSQELRKKFSSLKKLAGNINLKKSSRLTATNKKLKLFNENEYEEVKTEDMTYKEENESDCNNDLVIQNDIFNEDDNFHSDPLSTVLNSDSGIDVINQEDKEVVRLKLEILNYKKETAKLDRKRIQESMETEALEASLRLRAARLEAVAAALKLPPSHPALAFTPEESRAQEYLLQYQGT